MEKAPHSTSPREGGVRGEQHVRAVRITTQNPRDPERQNDRTTDCHFTPLAFWVAARLWVRARAQRSNATGILPPARGNSGRVVSRDGTETWHFGAGYGG